jgi:hypothetical protein
MVARVSMPDELVILRLERLAGGLVKTPLFPMTAIA